MGRVRTECRRTEMEQEVRKGDMGVTGRALMKIDSCYPCPDKQESPITSVTPVLSITAGWQALHWHERRASAASASASPY